MQKFDHDQFTAWRAKNSEGSYSQFSVEKIAASIAEGRPHPTLGPNLSTSNDWRSAGIPIFNQVMEMSQIPADAKVCEYGCGSMRIGVHFIERQPPGHYCGLDVTEDFIDYGRRLIGQNLLHAKRPLLGSIADNIDQAVQFDSQILFSTHVAIHVHPGEKMQFFRNIKKIAHSSGSTIIFDALISPQPVRFRNSGWGWPIGFYLENMQPFKLVSIIYRRDRDDFGQEFFFSFRRP